MNDPRVDEIMRLASLLATARCRRMVANKRNGGAAEVDHAEIWVQKRTAELRSYVWNALHSTPTKPDSATPS